MLMSAPWINVTCLNCGAIPTDEFVSHQKAACWRPGGDKFDDDRWIRECHDRQLTSAINLHKVLEEARTKGGRRAELAKTKHFGKRVEAFIAPPTEEELRQGHAVHEERQDTREGKGDNGEMGFNCD